MASIFKRKAAERPQLLTGSVIFDTLNGRKEKTSDGVTRTRLGIASSRIYALVGSTSTGKSSMAMDLAYHIVEPYENGHVYWMDFERAFEPSRVQQLTGLYIDQIDDKFDIIEDVGQKDLFDTKREPITVSSIGKLIRQIYDFKMEHKKELSTIIDGIATLEPTIVVVDSIAATITDKQQEKGESDNMTGATRAKDLGETFNILNPLLGEANITMFLVNHLHEDVNTGFTPKAAMLRDLKQGETMPGGKQLNYLIGTNVLLRRGPKLTEDKAYGIDGMYVNMMLIKSRGAETGKARRVIFVPSRGFLWDLSLFDYLVDLKKIEGSRTFTVPGYHRTVTRKEVVDLCDTDVDFVKALRAYGEEVLSEFIPDPVIGLRNLSHEEEMELEAENIAKFLDLPSEETAGDHVDEE